MSFTVYTILPRSVVDPWSFGTDPDLRIPTTDLWIDPDPAPSFNPGPDPDPAPNPDPAPDPALFISGFQDDKK